MKPLVSVIVPNYNHKRFLEQRLQSIEQQSFTDYEVWLLDDNSSDGSQEVLAAFAERHAHWQLVPNRQNSGSPFAQWNKGAALARGRYLWIAESDDWAHPRLLEELVPLLAQNDSVALAYAQSYLVNTEGTVLHSYEENLRFIYKTQRWQENFTVSGRQANREWLLFHNPIPNASGALLRLGAFRQAGPADASMRLNGDWLHYAKMLTHGDLAFTAQHLNYFRVHDASQREKARATGSVYREIIRINDFIRQSDPEAEVPANEALRKVAGWWMGSLPYQKRSGANWQVNRELYHFFRAYQRRLPWRILLTYAITWLRDLLVFLRLLQPLKDLRHRLFPHKYFKY